jgi:hypothetical protein
LTTNEVNAGKQVIEAQAKRAITIVDAWVRAIGGAAASNTSVDIQDTVSATKVCVFTRAGLAQNAVLRAGTVTTGASANLNVALGKGEGVKVLNVGTAMATASHLDYVILYRVDAVDQVHS